MIISMMVMMIMLTIMIPKLYTDAITINGNHINNNDNDKHNDNNDITTTTTTNNNNNNNQTAELRHPAPPRQPGGRAPSYHSAREARTYKIDRWIY